MHVIVIFAVLNAFNDGFIFTFCRYFSGTWYIGENNLKSMILQYSFI